MKKLMIAMILLASANAFACGMDKVDTSCSLFKKQNQKETAATILPNYQAPKPVHETKTSTGSATT